MSTCPKVGGLIQFIDIFKKIVYNIQTKFN